MTLPPEPNVVKRRIFLTLLPVVSIVAFGLGLQGLLSGRVAPYAAVIGMTSSVILMGFAFLFRNADAATFARIERLLIAVAVVVMGIAMTLGAVREEDRYALFELIRQGIWLPVVYGATFLVLPLRWGAIISASLWTILAVASSSHLLNQAGHSSSEVGTVVEILISNGIIILVLAGVAWVVRAGERRSMGLELAANTDPLTGLANRRRAEHRLEEELERASRYERPLSVVMFDLDRFKRVNDTLGHDMGDAVLRQVPVALAGRIRETDTLARWGGEEFVIVAPEMDVERAAQMAERFRRLIEAHAFGTDWPITASFGVAEVGEGEGVTDALRRADEAMYAAKRSGRNAVYRSTIEEGDTRTEAVAGP